MVFVSDSEFNLHEKIIELVRIKETLKRQIEQMEMRDHQLWLLTVSPVYESDKIRDFIEKYYR